MFTSVAVFKSIATANFSSKVLFPFPRRAGPFTVRKKLFIISFSSPSTRPQGTGGHRGRGLKAPIRGRGWEGAETPAAPESRARDRGPGEAAAPGGAGAGLGGGAGRAGPGARAAGYLPDLSPPFADTTPTGLRAPRERGPARNKGSLFPGSRGRERRSLASPRAPSLTLQPRAPPSRPRAGGQGAAPGAEGARRGTGAPAAAGRGREPGGLAGRAGRCRPGRAGARGCPAEPAPRPRVLPPLAAALTGAGPSRPALRSPLRFLAHFPPEPSSCTNFDGESHTALERCRLYESCWRPNTFLDTIATRFDGTRKSRAWMSCIYIYIFFFKRSFLMAIAFVPTVHFAPGECFLLLPAEVSFVGRIFCFSV